MPAAILPLAGIVGTVIGSFVWGWLADRIGRRPSIVLAGVVFVATSICGSMPSVELNLVMCFVMGLAVGGMLPITFALVAETIPARHRGWLMVLIGFPTGLVLILLNRWIPESPRFLLAHGREEEAHAVMDRYGAAIVTKDDADLEVGVPVAGRFVQLLRRPFAGSTTAIVLLGLGVGLVSFGFQLWIPSNLHKLGFTEYTSARILRDSALIGFPLNLIVAWMYGFWSSRKTVILLAVSTAAALFGFAWVGDAVTDSRVLLQVLLVIPIWGIRSPHHCIGGGDLDSPEHCRDRSARSDPAGPGRRCDDPVRPGDP